MVSKKKIVKVLPIINLWDLLIPRVWQGSLDRICGFMVTEKTIYLKIFSHYKSIKCCHWDLLILRAWPVCTPGA